MSRQTKAVLFCWLEQCKDNYHRMTQWEQNFIDSLSEQLESRGTLSEKQEEILERIYSEKTP